MVCILTYVAYYELQQLNIPEESSFDPEPFDLVTSPPDSFDDSDPSLPQNPIHVELPLELLKTGHHSKVHDLILVHQVGLDEIDPDNGYTLLHYLARSYNLAAMRFVLAKQFYGPDGINSRSKTSSNSVTPLHLAVTHPNPVLAFLITHLLIEMGADPSIPDYHHQTARDLANDDRLIKIIDKEYDPRAHYETDDRSFLDFAFGSRGIPADPCFFF